MLHYDASRTDRSALEWLRSAAAEGCYQYLVTDDGNLHALAPRDARAWHAGVCQSADPVRLTYHDANSAFYGVAIAATDGDTATPRQFRTVVAIVRDLFLEHGWPWSDSWRIVGHDAQAWPRGRKIDPTGSDVSRPVLSVARVRTAVREGLPELEEAPDGA